MRVRVAWRRTASAWAGLAVLLMTVAGCALIDQFAPRAIDYNYQTGDAKSATVLLNIMRAAYSQSLQFTDVSTLTAQATISATPSSSLPIAATHAAPARTFSVSPGGTLSGGNSVNVANLNTQEFYYGLQSPLKTQQIASYLVGNDNISPYILFPLIISDIEVDHGGTKAILHNRADNYAGFFAFYSAMSALIEHGLTVAPSSKKNPTTVGPHLTPEQAKNPKLLSALIAAASASSASSTDSGSGSAGSGSGGITLAPGTIKDSASGKQTPARDANGDPSFYQLQKGGGGSSDFNFCFREAVTPEVASQNGIGFSVARTSSTRSLSFPLGFANGKGVQDFTIQVSPTHLCDSVTPAGSTTPGGRQQPADNLILTPRSLEGVFYYLGEMVRTELAIGIDQANSLAIPGGDQGDFHLFRLERRLPVGEEPWITYDGQIFAMRVDPTGSNDASSRVLALLTDLLALQSSAKSLPAPNVISVLNP